MQTDGCEELIGPGSRIGDVGQLEGKQYVFTRRQISKKLERLEDEADRAATQERESVFGEILDRPSIQDDLAFGRAIESGHESEQR